MKAISVIVPAYNAKDYLDTCFGSLLNQTFRDFEIVAVNDGSKDDTLQILNRYQETYPDLFVVLSQENHGLSVTRNNGVAAASGEYIFFLDSDDWLKPNALELLYNKATETGCDVVCCNVDCVYPDKTVEVRANADMHTGPLSLDDRKKLFSMYPIVCNKLYKREIFTEKHMRFIPGVWFEDVVFTTTLISQIDRIASVDEALYEYLQRPNSITYTYSDKLTDVNVILHKTLDFYKEKGLYEDYQDALEAMYVRYMFATYIKRLSKAKDWKRFCQGVGWSMGKVRENFPYFRRNPILTQMGLKGLYLRLFNPLFAYAIFFAERNRMN